MDEKQETIADIVAEMRREADELEASSYKPYSFLRERIAELRQEADRIEAAYKREIDELKSSAASAPSGATCNNTKIDIGNLTAVMNKIRRFYHDHYWTATTWNFFIRNAAKVLEGEMSISEFRALSIPAPKDGESIKNF